jgi:Flp pilus assembly protein TadB
MARHSSLRASDADRDAVAERLRQAAVEGRLEPWELEQRLHTALRARTYGELDPLLRDLPPRSVARRRDRPPQAASAGVLVLMVAVRLIVALMIVAALAFAFAVTAAWWLLGLIVWISVRTSRRSCSAWHRPPRAWRA